MHGKRVRRADRHVVEDAKAHRAAAFRVVPRWTHGAERRLVFAAANKIDGVDDRARRMQRRFDRMGIERGIRIEIPQAARRCRTFDGFDIRRRMDARQLFPRRRRRFVTCDVPVDAGRDQLVADRRQAFRALGMVRAHFVLQAGRMREVGSNGHGIRIGLDSMGREPLHGSPFADVFRQTAVRTTVRIPQV